LNNSRTIQIHNRQRAVKIDLGKLQSFAMRALAMCTKAQPGKNFTARKLPAIHVILISDRRTSELHRRFLQLGGPTDVITFQHGEIFISGETARRHARTLHTSLIKELQLYLVHGLLHLRGFDDKTPSSARVMRRMQEQIARRAAKM
jgi:probable rRNA maturation factor